MALDRQGTGLTCLRIMLGVFFLFQGLSKLRWFVHSSLLAQQLAGWHRGVAPGSSGAWYLERVAIPYTGFFARLVPLGEICSGLAMLAGFWTPLAAFIAFFMTLNFHIASGGLFTHSFLIDGYGLPVLGGTLALAIGGVRLPWSIRN